jgi:hypothetical protein
MRVLVELQVSQKSLDEIRKGESGDPFNVDELETDAELLKKVVDVRLHRYGMKSKKVTKLV